jgi:hypothetical protein
MHPSLKDMALQNMVMAKVSMDDMGIFFSYCVMNNQVLLIGNSLSNKNSSLFKPLILSEGKDSKFLDPLKNHKVTIGQTDKQTPAWSADCSLFTA